MIANSTSKAKKVPQNPASNAQAKRAAPSEAPPAAWAIVVQGVGLNISKTWGCDVA